ncbi:TRAP transporter small permease [Georgenia sp. 311]|uniref:TRAP transporter small permease n=1 Tax=Georgenia wutianyii TaxID=2585135 RepID=A0ABX5VN85_9MICO|nr:MULTISPECIES: TRAP transporter small permease [Georgenia]QDB79695.1 TRAP transporter small permease [Georgenia wutianyii]TNC16571.1 TRAP transporter small permease [Georgenia sp. 311]
MTDNNAATGPDPTPQPASAADRGTTPRPQGGPIVRALEAVRSVIDRILVLICIVTFVVLVVVVSWQVISRQVVGTPATWTEETARYIFVVLALLVAALVFSERGHIAVEIFVERLPKRFQLVVALVVEALVVAFAVYVMIYGGIAVSQNAWGQNISTLPLTIGQIYLVLPVSGALITFFSICHVVGMFVGTEDTLPDVDENNQGI